MNKEKIVDYLDKQFWKHKKYECMPENETGYEYVPREALSKIVDGLIPLVKSELKNCSIPVVSQQRELLLDFLSKINGNLITHPHLQMNTDFVDEYIKSNNCG